MVFCVFDDVRSQIVFPHMCGQNFQWFFTSILLSVCMSLSICVRNRKVYCSTICKRFAKHHVDCEHFWNNFVCVVVVLRRCPSWSRVAKRKEFPADAVNKSGSPDARLFANFTWTQNVYPNPLKIARITFFNAQNVHFDVANSWKIQFYRRIVLGKKFRSHQWWAKIVLRTAILDKHLWNARVKCLHQATGNPIYSVSIGRDVVATTAPPFTTHNSIYSYKN